MPKHDHYVIIGNGPAGNSAAETLRSHDDEARITIISNESFEYYYRHKLTDFIMGKVNEKDLVVKPYSTYKKGGIRLRLGQQVDRIDPNGKILYLNHMEKISYSMLIIATGGSPRILPSISNFSDALRFMYRYTDASALASEVKDKSDFLILGGDIISLRFVKMLKKMGKNVRLILYGDAFWPFHLTGEMAAQVTLSLEKQGVEVIVDDILELVCNDKGDYHVKTKKGVSGTYDLVFSFLGMVPNIKFLLGSGIDTDRGILVDDRLKTNFDDIYACGDCAQIYNPEIKSYWVSVGWKNALLQGKTAVMNMLGAHNIIKPVPQNILDVEGVKINTSWWDTF